MSDVENPWAAETWNLTKQGEYVKVYGLERAKLKAKKAGAKFGLYPVMRATAAPYTVIVQRRFIGTGGGGSVTIGDGDPQ